MTFVAADAGTGQSSPWRQLRDTRSCMAERRTLKRESLHNGKILSWTVVEVFDGTGALFDTKRELFTLNYESISNAEGERLVEQLNESAWSKPK